MSAVLEKLKAQALKLSAPDRDELARALMASIDGDPEDTPEAIARAWDEEIARRVADLDAGRTTGIPFEQVLAEVRAMIASHGEERRQSSSPRPGRNSSNLSAGISRKRERVGQRRPKRKSAAPLRSSN